MKWTFTGVAAPDKAGSSGGKSETGGAQKETAKNTEPVTLTFYKYFAGLTDKEFDDYFVQPVKKKFPNVTLKSVAGKVTGPTSPANIIASGENPDLIFTSNASINVFKSLQMATDLNDLIKKNKLDLKRIDPVIVDALKQYGDKGETYAIPFSLNFAGLFYNKDIFDKFAVSYPKDLSTWDDMLELDRKLTRSDGGMQYRGIIVPEINKLGMQMSIPYLDKKTSKAAFETNGWKKAFELYTQFYQIPGMLADGKIPPRNPDFFENKLAALYPNFADQVIPALQDMKDKGVDFNWDMTTYPSFKDRPGIGMSVDFHLLMVSKSSKHPDLVFDIINYLSSDDLQLNMTKSGRMTMLDNTGMKKQYGQTMSAMQGKNIAGLLKSKSANIKDPSDYDTMVNKILQKAGFDAGMGKVDMNTAISQAQEAADKAIAEEKAK